MTIEFYAVRETTTKKFYNYQNGKWDKELQFRSNVLQRKDAAERYARFLAPQPVEVVIVEATLQVKA